MDTRETNKSKTTMGQRMAVAMVAVGLGSVAFGLVGFKKHQRDADEIEKLAIQHHATRSELLAPDAVHPSERMARWNLLIWAGVGFSYFGVSLGVAVAMLNRMRGGKANAPQTQSAQA